MIKTLCNGESHIINITKYIYLDENKYKESKDSSWGTLQPFFDKGFFDFHVDENENILPCISFSQSFVDYDFDYGFDGEDEYPITTTTERNQRIYLPINKCPFCGQDIKIVIDNVIDLREEETQIVQELERLRKKGRLSKKEKNEIDMLYEKFNLLKGGYSIESEKSTIIENPLFNIYTKTFD